MKFNLESADENGEFSGYAAVFGNVDAGGDVIEKGAFAKTIAEDFDRIKILSQHNEQELPIGKPLELREDDKGLYIRGKISDTQKGRDIQTLLRDGVLNELSIGYSAIDFEVDGTSGIRHLKEVQLWEISIVTWAMNGLAQIDGVKSLVEELKIEAKGGKISRSKIVALKPFIDVVKELTEILSPFLEPQEPAPASGESDIPSITTKQKKSSGIRIEIVPAKN